MNRKTGMLLATIVTALLIPHGISIAHAQGIHSDVHMPYALGDIEHSFAAMEEYVVYSKNKSISFDTINAMRDSSVSELDIEIASEFAVHSNDIINATFGHLAQTNELEAGNLELKRAVQELEGGKFSAMFGTGGGSAGRVNDIMPVLYEYATVSPIFLQKILADEPQEVRHGSRSSAIACNGGFQNPHPVPAVIPKRWFTTEFAAERYLINNGYHQVPLYASGNYGNDFAKTTTAYHCDSGEMRSQVVVFQTGSYWRHNTQSPEPNPEILAYGWPAYWWGAYVAWWHVNF